MLKYVCDALSHKQRWNDPEYFGRILFQELIGDNKGFTGYGISGTEPGDGRLVAIIDCENQRVEQGGISISFDSLAKEGVHYE